MSEIRRSWDDVRAECEAPDGGTMPCGCVRAAPHRADPDCVKCHGLGWIDRPLLHTRNTRPASAEEMEMLSRTYRAHTLRADPALQRSA